MANRNRQRGNRRSILRIAAPFALLIGLLALVTGCAWSVKPPPDPRHPRTVFITDYGRHSRLAMQMDDERVIEYSFGDWRYYGVGDNSLWRGIVALTTPTDPAFGRRILPFVDNETAFTQTAGAERAARIQVEQELVDDLLADLDARYLQNIDTEIHADWTDLTFVREDSTYHLFRNSNHQTAAWLRELGCEVRGVTILSNFRLEGKDAHPDRTARASFRHPIHHR